jgi:S1-C subfamily serine protease
MYGEVVGINTALPPDSSATGIGFAVGSDVAKAVVEQLRANGRVNRGFLGIGPFEALRPAKAKDLNIPDGVGGLVVGAVSANGPAGAAGLRAGDVITRLGNTEVRSETDLTVALIKNAAGQRVTVEYYRDGKKASLDVTLGTPAS